MTKNTYQLVLVDANLDGPILKRAYDKQIPTCSLKFLHLFSLKFAWQLIYEELSHYLQRGQCHFKVALYMKPYLILIIFLHHFSGTWENSGRDLGESRSVKFYSPGIGVRKMAGLRSLDISRHP